MLQFSVNLDNTGDNPEEDPASLQYLSLLWSHIVHQIAKLIVMPREDNGEDIDEDIDNDTDKDTDDDTDTDVDWFEPMSEPDLSAHVTALTGFEIAV